MGAAAAAYFEEREIRRQYFLCALVRAYYDLFITLDELVAAMRRADLEQNWGAAPPGLAQIQAPPFNSKCFERLSRP
jgi:hypothetical protein